MSEHRAYLGASHNTVVTALTEIAEKNGFEISRNALAVTIDAPLGRVELRGNAQGTDVSF
ncbi:MAG: hypothetical protein AAF718_12935 [Pseudomonadota bacterium]